MIDEIVCPASTITYALDAALDGQDPTSIPCGPYDTLAVLTAHGYPHTRQMRDNRDALRRLGELKVCFDIDTPAIDLPAPTPPRRSRARDDTHTYTYTPRTYQCAPCGRTFDRPQGLATHRRHSAAHRTAR